MVLRDHRKCAACVHCWQHNVHERTKTIDSRVVGSGARGHGRCTRHPVLEVATNISDHLQYKGPREKPLHKTKGLVGAFSFSKKALQAFCRGFYSGPLYTEGGLWNRGQIILLPRATVK
jgi:hypothetical protein